MPLHFHSSDHFSKAQMCCLPGPSADQQFLSPLKTTAGWPLVRAPKVHPSSSPSAEAAEFWALEARFSGASEPTDRIALNASSEPYSDAWEN